MDLGLQEKYSEYFKKNIPTPILETVRICLGDLNFLIKNNHSKCELKILILTEDVSFSDLQSLKPSFVFDEAQFLSSSIPMSDILSYLNKKNKILDVKKSTERKKKELESLNAFLSDESNVKKSIMSDFKKQELGRKSVEKKLLYFFDFINSESQRSDFVNEVMNLLAVELRKISSFYKIGFLFKSKLNPAFIFETDGSHEKSKVVEDLDEVNKLNLTSFLANLWQRPIGKVFTWNVESANAHFLFYIENQNYESTFENYDLFLKDRISLIAISVQQWFLETIEKKIYNQWNQIFRTYKDPIHVIDEHYNLVHSNYDYNQETHAKCYEVLAFSKKPCRNCPRGLQLLSSKIEINDQQYESNATEFVVDSKKYYFISYENLTEMNTLKSNFIQNEKMSALGKLANHLMHELNNPLTGLKMYAELLMADSPVESKHLRSDLEEVLKAVVRCQTIISDLSRFAHDQPLALEKINIKNVVEKTLVFLKSIIRKHKLFVDVKSIEVMGHFTYLQQVLFNLLKNSCQAMSNDGAIKIYLVESETCAELYIEDEGPGLPESVLASLFKPFTSSKSYDQGTGLGLYLSKKMIQQMNAELVYDSTYVNGSRFIIRFAK